MTTIVVTGVPYRFAKLDARTYQEFLDWAVTQIPDPVDELLATAAKLPEGMRERFIADRIDAAVEKKSLRGALNDPAVQGFAQTLPAVARLVWLLLARHHPTLTQEQALQVVLDALAEHGEGAFEPVFRQTRTPATEDQVEAEYFRGHRAGGPAVSAE